ncbi:alpha/beta hydrolase-fold protein [uncultured Erythrobacter sp.]|uniref:alpha/beta hydrolase n=1 Tax=uncultured Erythrobacter sp. TaxID=263913 RepID=UPI00260B799E|nr:alpha/beta hydrolase-fold protein [uncultured Erythrobacter sp.]
MADEEPPSEPITIGTSYTLETHGAERRVNVILPRDYEAGTREYPILLVLDGGMDQDLFLTLGLSRWNQLWGRSEAVIFVGIETVDRQRELLPPTSDLDEQTRYPSAGESTAFRAWLTETVVALLRENYRSDGRFILAGESAAGHFVAETWALHPDLFDGYAAISPSLQWSGQALATRFEQMDSRTRPPLYISLADEGGATEEGIERLVAKAGENLCFSDRREELVHANALHGLLPEALQFLLPT